MSPFQVDDAQLETNIRWADGFILIYSVSDRKSFEFVERHLALVLRLRTASPPSSSSSSHLLSSAAGDRRRRGDPPNDQQAAASQSQPTLPPIVIAANKTDCPPDARHVTVDEGQQLADMAADGRTPSGSISVRELSVAENPLDVAELVDDVGKQVTVVRQQLLQQQKGSSRSTTPSFTSSPSSSAAHLASSSPPTTTTGSGSPTADRMSATLTNVRRVLRDKIYNRSRSDTLMTAGGTGGGLTIGK